MQKGRAKPRKASYSGADPGMGLPQYGTGAFSAFCIPRSAFAQKLLYFSARSRYLVFLGKDSFA
jgi:hypothetical protein